MRRPSARTSGLDVAWRWLPWLLPAIASLMAPLRTTDLAYHVRLGADMLDGGGIPRVDGFTFSVAGTPWVDQQWLAQVVLAATAQLGDTSALAVLGATLIASSIGIVSMACRAAGATVRAAAGLSIAAFVVAAPMLAVRPQLFGVAGVAVCMWAVTVRERRVWLLPVVALALANLHGSFPVIVVIALLSAATTPRVRRGWLVLAATAMATLLNPFGVGVWGYVIDITTDPVIRRQVSEWAAPSLTDPAGLLAAASLVGVIWIGVLRRAHVRRVDLAWLGAFAAPAIVSQRAVVWWALVAPVIVARWLVPEREAGQVEGVAEPRDRSGPGRKIVTIVAILLIIALPWWRGGTPLEDAPRGVAETLAELPAGTRVLVYQPWASWVEYAAPGILTYVDSRIELFPEETWAAYDAIAAGDIDRLEAIGADVIAGAQTWAPITLLVDHPGWRQIYAGPDGVVLTRQTSLGRAHGDEP